MTEQLETLTFQEIILRLHRYWGEKGCLLMQPYDVMKGAGTLNPATFLRSLGPEPWRSAYVEPSRRPTDGRYGENPFRLQHYYQYQVLLKPAPADAQKLYEDSLRELGIDLVLHDVRYVEDDWEQPTFGAAGLGWEIWLDGMEVTQFTYFQQVGGLDLDPVCLELTYGIERIAMFIQGAPSTYDLTWVDDWSYGDVHLETEQQGSTYNFEQAPVDLLRRHFEEYEEEAKRLIDADLVFPAYDQVLLMSHAFNLLDARRAISVSQRVEYIGRIRRRAQQVARAYVAHREELGFPFLNEQENPTEPDDA